MSTAESSLIDDQVKRSCDKDRDAEVSSAARQMGKSTRERERIVDDRKGGLPLEVGSRD